jgi:5-methyltetrahydropteroyltriglutamate--homocysteine methyltransferase
VKRSIDRILTTHVGSLPRPEPVVRLLERREQGQLVDDREFAAVVGEAVAAAVQRQVDVGIDAVSDGEMSKASYATYVKDRLTGFDGAAADRRVHRDLADHPELRRKMALLTGPQIFRRPSCTGPVAVKDSRSLQEDIQRLRRAGAAASAAELFMNAASPGVVASFLPNEHYPTHDAYVGAIAAAMQPEYEAISDAGLLLQVDCPDLAMSRHSAFQELTEAEFLKRAERHVEALNAALANVPAESVRIHICWGNYEGPHDHDIPISRILPVVLKLRAAALLIEASNPRHAHEWTVWREVKLPDDKVLVPGVIDTSTNFVEHPELVAERLCRFADVVGRERVIAGTDCGFGTSAGHGKLDPDVSFKKLASLVEGARLASRRLWPQRKARVGRRSPAPQRAQRRGTPPKKGKVRRPRKPARQRAR